MVHMNKEEITKMQISRIEKEVRDTPYHKATEHHIGRLRAKLSKLKDSQKLQKPKGGGGGGGYAVKKQGDATVVLVGPPSAGKSTLLNKLTNAKSKIAPYEFTTLTVIPGMMIYKDARVQILDVPGLIEGAEEGKGRGREVISVVRGSDLIIKMSDIKRPNAINTINEALYNNGIRLNENPPDVSIEKKLRGGMIIHSNIKQDFDNKTVSGIAKEFGYTNAEVTIKEKLNIDRLIDSFSRNRVYIPSLTVLNKSDQSKTKRRPKNIDLIISAEKDIDLDKLKELVWEKLNFVRVYLVRTGEKPSKNHPLVVKSGITLNEVIVTIGEEFAENKKRAVIWGNGAKFPGQKVSLSKRIKEGMQIRFI